MTNDILLIALAWAGYGGLHSLLAAPSPKAWILDHLPGMARYYRLGYNILATVLLIPLLLATEWAADDWLWRWQGAWAWVAHGVTVIVMLGFMWSSRAYDMRVFMGLGEQQTDAPAGFGLSPLHRWVRHPWYTLGLLWLWTRDMDSARLAAALTITLYIWLGAYLEDRKLEREWGARYRDYRAKIPGLLPRPWRYLSRTDYENLQR
jgi:protein-S-isoprenylcysteine O-methyltransferase Ste14